MCKQKKIIMTKEDFIKKIETCYNLKNNNIILIYGINQNTPIGVSQPELMEYHDMFSSERIKNIPKWIYDNCELLYGICLLTY